MKLSISGRLFLFFAAISSTLFSLHAQDTEHLVSSFKGSIVIGNYHSRFAPLSLLVNPLDIKKNPSVRTEEGSLNSTIYERPQDVSSYEVYSSYRKTLESADFDLLLACEKGKCNVKQMVKATYGHPLKELTSRTYDPLKGSVKDYLVGWADYYISAKKKTEDKTYFVMIIISEQKGLYSVDVLQVETMEEMSVVLAPELLKEKIKSEGRAVLEGIYFEFGKSILTEASSASIKVLSSYLKENPGLSFYVVGHTDDVGEIDRNIALSNSRAEAVIKELSKNEVNTSKLMGHGAGPFSPVSTNQSEEGKKKNRRVELVLRLD